MKKLFLKLICLLMTIPFIPFVGLNANEQKNAKTEPSIRYELILERLEDAVSYDEYGYPYLDDNKVDNNFLTDDEMNLIHNTIKTSNENRESFPHKNSVEINSRAQTRGATVSVLLFLLGIAVKPATYYSCKTYGGEIWSMLVYGQYKVLPEPHRSNFYYTGWAFLNACWANGW